jgi:phosphate-selective porin OprO and OprP
MIRSKPASRRWRRNWPRARPQAPDPSGFALTSPDGQFSLSFTGLVQADARFFLEDDADAGADSFLMRRVRPGIRGRLGDRLSFRIVPEFAGSASLLDAHADVTLWPSLRLRAGKFKAPFGLERLQSGSDLRFIERGQPTGLAPNRDLGLQFYGDLAGGTVSYAAGLFNGVPDGGSADSDLTDDKDAVARLMLTPLKSSDLAALKGLSFGLAASYGREKGAVGRSSLSGYRSPGQASVFSYRSSEEAADSVWADGERVRLAPQLTYHFGPFGLLAEYTQASHDVRRGDTTDTLTHEAWQIAASWILTGEANSFGGVTPNRPLHPAQGQWGAWELAARLGELNLDGDSFPTYANPDRAITGLQAWAVGLNWYPQKQFKAAITYEHTTFDGGAEDGADREDEQALFARLQVSF